MAFCLEDAEIKEARKEYIALNETKRKHRDAFNTTMAEIMIRLLS